MRSFFENRELFTHRCVDNIKFSGTFTKTSAHQVRCMRCNRSCSDCMTRLQRALYSLYKQMCCCAFGFAGWRPAPP